MLKILRRRFYNLHIIIYPVRVQGEYAAFEIAQAIYDFNKLKDKVDVLIVGRGGGSIEDLWAFNEEIVARAIFASEIPVISAVGHERDWTISALFADLRAPTPSAAAELVVRRKDELEEMLSIFHRRMRVSILSILNKKRQELNSLAGRYGLYRIKDLLPQKMQRLDELSERIGMRIRNIVSDRKERMVNLLKQLENLNPLAILSRGYSLSLDLRTGKIIREFSQVSIGQLVRTKLYKGSFISRVEKIEPQ
jgi:exodeoxyribonuclease VII large subunit